MDTGAYFVPFSTTFSFPRPSILLQEDDRVTPIWRRELFEDLVRYDVDDRAD
jgi:diaminopimelate decarboxylase